MAENGLSTLLYLVGGVGVFLTLVYQLGLKSLLLYIIVGLVGFSLGLGIILCSGNRKKNLPKQQPPVGFNILVTKVMVSSVEKFFEGPLISRLAALLD